jgi:hypothetical protein
MTPEERLRLRAAIDGSLANDKAPPPEPGEIVYLPMDGSLQSGVLWETPVIGWRYDEQFRKIAVLGQPRRVAALDPCGGNVKGGPGCCCDPPFGKDEP